MVRILPSKTTTAKQSGLTNTPGLFGRFAIAGINLNVAEPEVPVEESSYAPDLIAFRFGTAVVDAGNNTAVFDPYNHIGWSEYGGRFLLTDGMTINKEYDGDEVVDLEILAPSTKPSVAVDTPAGSGITGSFRYWFRYKNSKTGKVSGWSPKSDVVSPSAQEVNVTSITLSTDDQVDRIQVARSLTTKYHTKFVVTELDNSGTPTYADETTDEDLADNENGNLVVGRTYNEGRMWPMLHSFSHFGFVFYYGIVRMPKYTAGDVDVTNGSQEITGNNGCRVRYARLGQKFIVDGDTTAYTIIDVDESNNKFYVYPEIDRANGSALSYYIEDNRDAGVAEISVNGRPGTVPITQRLHIGSNPRDDLHLIFELADSTFAITKSKIVKLRGDRTEEPWYSLVLDTVVSEGASGPEAITLVPGLGLVYMNEKLGPRLFDGNRSVNLGRSDEETDILAEWQRFRAANKRDTVVRHDNHRNLVHVSYARDTDPANRWRVVLSPATREWLGPWTNRVFEYGELLDSDLTVRNIIGTDMGVLMQDHRGDRDGFAAGTLKGTISSVSGKVLTVSGANFDTTEDGLFGAPLVLVSPTGSVYYEFSVSNTSDTITMRGFPSSVPISGWTLHIAPIDWNIKTGYLDMGDPHHSKTLYSLQLRHDRSGSGTLRAASSVEGGSFYNCSNGEQEISGRVHTRFRFEDGGKSFQLYVAGIGSGETPEITSAIVEMEPRRGEND